MKNSNDTTGNRTRNSPTCSAVPQPTAPSSAVPPPSTESKIEWSHIFMVCLRTMLTALNKNLILHTLFADPGGCEVKDVLL